jgi:hypothetical protein
MQVAGIAAVTLVALASSARANPVLDFSTGLADPGGMITLFSDGSVSGVGIPIGRLAIAGAPAGNGGYAVAGSVMQFDTFTQTFDTYGSLDFATGGMAGSNFIEIDGYLPSRGSFGGVGSASSPLALMNGSFSNFSLNHDLSGNVNGLGGAVGWALTSPLATLVGLSTDLQYTFLGWSMTTDPLTAQNPSGSVISTDIRATAVPEPGSIMLLGSGLLFAAGSMKRRFNL